MAVRRGTSARTGRTTVARKAAPTKATTTRRAAKAAPAAAPKARARSGRDVTQYADKPPTDYHKAYAKWIVTEVGYDPNSAPSQRSAFLHGVSIATAARSAFNESDFLEEWRERTGVAKRGPKRRDEEPAEEIDEDEAEDFDSDDESDDEDDADDEFDEDESDDDSDEDESDDDSDEFDEDDEPEPAPKARSARGGRATTATRRSAPTARKAAPAKASGRTRKAASDDDFLF